MMRPLFLCCSLTVALGCLAGTALADGLECTPKTLVIVDSPETVSQIVVNPITIGPACTDTNGSHLTLTDVSAPAAILPNKPGFSKNSFTITNDLQVGQSRTVNFTVTDESGLQVTSYITIERQNPPS